MNATRINELDQEPMGIVISRGSRAEHVPTVFAYVWAPAPEVERQGTRGCRSLSRFAAARVCGATCTGGAFDFDGRHWRFMGSVRPLPRSSP